MAVALVALVGALIGTAAVGRWRHRSVLQLAEEAAEAKRDAVEEAIHNELKLLEGRALAAASLQEIRERLVSFDAKNLKGELRSSPWWQPYRDEFSFYGVSLEGTRFALVDGTDQGGLIDPESTSTPNMEAVCAAMDEHLHPLVDEALLGATSAAQPDVGRLIAHVRKRRVVSCWITARSTSEHFDLFSRRVVEWPYLAAAATIDVPGRREPAVLMLARAVDQAFVQNLAGRVGAVLLTGPYAPGGRFGRTLLLAAGNEQHVARLKNAASKGMGTVTEEGERLVDALDIHEQLAQGSDVAFSGALVDEEGLWATWPGSPWIYVDISAKTEVVRRVAHLAVMGLWGVAVAMVAFALFFALRAPSGQGPLRV